jgi:AraC family transcriptional regulator
MRRLETLKLLNDALEYIEINLNSELNIDNISKIAGSSKYHFQRIFHVLTGFTVSQYIKNRRLTLAAEELIVEDKRVIDIALKYGYESPEAFTKAFKRMHGTAPSALKKYNGKIKAFPKISFQILIKGGGEINYRIVESEAFKIFGAGFITTAANDAAYEHIPKFINEIFENGTHDRINQVLGKSKGTLLNGYHYGFKEDGTRKYIMGDEVVNDHIPDEFTQLSIPKLTWAVFEDNGVKPDNLIIQNIWKRIYSEWFPSSGFEQAEGPCIEKNFWNGEKQSGYRCEVWIPVRRK